MSGLDNQPQNPLTDDERRLVDANANHIGECPNPECDRTVQVYDMTDDGVLYASHEEDRFGLASRSPRGETDGCRISAENDPTR